MFIEDYSTILQQKRKKMTRAFLMSLALHIAAIALISLSYITIYRPMFASVPLTKDELTITSIKRFHISSKRKRSIPRRRSLSSNTVKVTEHRAAQPINSTRPITTGNAMTTVGTDADVPIAETSLSEIVIDSPQMKAIAIENPTSPTIAPVAEMFQEQTEDAQDSLEDAPMLVDRDGMMGDALEGIAESVADNEDERIVDVVFLLDISGSMIDNIRAVGRQLNQMATVFEDKGIDFRLGIVIFRYLEDDTIVHQPKQNIEQYKRLLTSHVVAAAGDERAHNAIVKAIRRVKFREEANRRFVLVTDEASKGSYKLLDVLRQCQQNQIVVDVIGIPDTTHLALTSKTGGLWYPIPIQE